MSYAAVAMGMFSVAYSLRFISVFFGTPAQGLPRDPHEPPRWMRFPVELLVLACLVVGVAPGVSIEPLLHLAVVATLGEDAPAYDLAVWHGFNLPLLMSVCALVGGMLLYGCCAAISTWRGASACRCSTASTARRPTRRRCCSSPAVRSGCCAASARAGCSRS